MNQLNLNNSGNANGMWPFSYNQIQTSSCLQNNSFLTTHTPTTMQNWAPQQLFLLQQQLQQKNFIEFKQQLQQQNQHQQILINQNANSIKSNFSPSSSSASSSSTSSPVGSANSNFSSSFSVNSLLNGNTHLQPPSSSSSLSSPLSLTPDKMNNVNQAQTTATVFGQHIATAIANYRLLQQQHRLPLYPLNESTFQQTQESKKLKFNDSISNGNETTTVTIMPNNNSTHGLNLSQCSIASPSSSSSSSYSSSDFGTNFSSIHHQNSVAGKFAALNESNEFVEYKRESSCSPKIEVKAWNDNKQQNRRSSKEDRKRLLIDLDLNPTCPICGLSLNLDDLQTHLELELESLKKLNSSMKELESSINSSSSSFNISSNFNKASGSSSLSQSNQRKRTYSENDDKSLANQNQQINAKRYLVFSRIKENRQERSKNKIRFTRMKENFNSSVKRNNIKNNNLHNKVICPLCEEDITGLKESINFHLEECFSTSKFELNAATESGRSSSKPDMNFKRKINTDENDLNKSKRVRTSSNSHDEEGVNNIEWNNSDSIESSNNEILVEDLNSNERLVETSKDSNTSRCLNCKETRTTGAVSIKCGHVFCNKCWFNSLDDRNSCLNCNLPTDFTDLRRIYL